MHRGYAKLWRKLNDSDLMGRGLKTIGMFSWLLLRANRTAAQLRGEWVHPGSLVTSISNLSDIFMESSKVLRRILKELEDDGMIRANNWANRGTKITICNWATYQTLPCIEGQTEGTPEGTPKGTRLKKAKKAKKEYILSPRSVALAERLRKLIISKKNLNITQSQCEEWCKHIELLERVDNVDYDRQDEGMTIYEDGFGRPYWPVIESGSAWRKKFTKIEEAKARDANRPPQPSKQILKDHPDFHLKPNVAAGVNPFGDFK